MRRTSPDRTVAAAPGRPAPRFASPVTCDSLLPGLEITASPRGSWRVGEVNDLLDLSVVIAGAAGEGVQTIGEVFSRSLLRLGYPVFTTQEYESRIRGGNSSYSVRISEEPRSAPRADADVLLALNRPALDHYRRLLRAHGLLLAEEGESHEESAEVVALPFARTAAEQFGTKRYANSVAAGALIAAVGGSIAHLEALLRETFADKGNDVADANAGAARAGHALAIERLARAMPPTLVEKKVAYTLLSANEAIPLAAAHAGCRFIAAYPMSPSTEIITALARDEGLGVFVEQAEDEISAVNMALGASYAGARAMTATSGGGFCLMVEALSLAGMTETSLVVVLAQRPGPSTGLPTRTAQGDLLFAIHAGHGEFPKAVLAPSDPQDAFDKTVRAFDLADRYQVPVVLMTDQFLADSRFSIESFRLPPRGAASFADPEAITDYRRYQLTPDGVSPRLYPGQSDHLVTLDSDEHDEDGHITEDLATVRPAMVEKRQMKLRVLQREVTPPEEIEVQGADTVLVSWGSTRGAVLEAVRVRRAAGARVGMVHFTELWPLPSYDFPKAKFVIVEGNATGQLGWLLRAGYGVVPTGEIHRADGLPITADDVQRGLDAV